MDAAVDTRGRKTGAGVTDLWTRWRDETAALGFDAHRVTRAVRAEQAVEPDPLTVDAVVEALSVRGSTWTLRAAAADLAANGRVVFGVAPSAKAARVLERDTGITSDTVHKLIHEHQRTDQQPAVRYQLPAGATAIVDEAGMLGTAMMSGLTLLADRHRWRLVLIGDPHQLQAVGRGGLFHELTTTGRTHHLDRIHRFTNQWEAAASLLLRHGDPRAIDTYHSRRPRRARGDPRCRPS